MDRRKFLRMIPGIVVLPKVIEGLAPEETGIIGCTGPTGPTVFQPVSASAMHWVYGVEPGIPEGDLHAWMVRNIASAFEVPPHIIGFTVDGKAIYPKMEIHFDPKRLPE